MISKVPPTLIASCLSFLPTRDILDSEFLLVCKSFAADLIFPVTLTCVVEFNLKMMKKYNVNHSDENTRSQASGSNNNNETRGVFKITWNSFTWTCNGKWLENRLSLFL